MANMNRGLGSLSAALALLLAGGSACAQAALPGAEPAADIRTFEIYEAFQRDATTDDWSLTPNEAAAVLDAVANDYVRGYNSSGHGVHVRDAGRQRAGSERAADAEHIHVRQYRNRRDRRIADDRRHAL